MMWIAWQVFLLKVATINYALEFVMDHLNQIYNSSIIW
jgi:hypothetical protein